MRSQIFAVIKSAIEDLNDELHYDHLNRIDDNTPLYDGGGLSIDSLSLVTLITEIELRMNDELGREIILADEKAMSMKNSPYRNVGTLVDFIAGRIEIENV